MAGADTALLLLLALVGLYSPLAAIASYIPLVQQFDEGSQRRLSAGLALNVAVIVVVTLLIGEPLLELLGLTPAALSAAGGIALIIASVPLMIGRSEAGSSDDPEAVTQAPASWRSIVFMPLTFPLTVGGATVAILVGFRAEAQGATEVTWLIGAGLTHALITGTSVYIAGHIGRRISDRGRQLMDRIAGIILTAIAATLLASGFSRLILNAIGNA